MKKKFFFVLAMVFLCSIILYSQPHEDNVPEYSYASQNPTYANFPKPEEVLVVYNLIAVGDSSKDVAYYYRDKRTIPNVNLLGLTIPTEVYYGNDLVSINSFKEDVRGDGILPWYYFRDYIATPIEDYLNNTTVNGQLLAEKIRYIVLCRGIPHKLWPLPFHGGTHVSSKRRYHISVSALLSTINQPGSHNYMDLYNTRYDTSQTSAVLLNPYYNVDNANLTINFRFKSNHFENSQGWYLQYMVSWLQGDSYPNIYELIDRSIDADMSGEKTWVIDDNENRIYNTNLFMLTHNKLNELGFSLNPETYHLTTQWITEDPNSVSGYVSWGANCGMPRDYITNTLEFDYMNGANFLSWESFNGWSFGMYFAPQNQALLSDFILAGGTGGSCHPYEPYLSGITQQLSTFPAYAMGYSIVDAHYMGMRYLSWQNMVVGDPLLAIAWGKQTLYENKTLSETNLVTGVVTVPGYHSLTLEDEAVVNFKHDGFITGDGFVVTEGDFTINIQDWSESVLKSRGLERDVPRIIWGGYPTSTPEALVVERRLNFGGSWDSFAELDPGDREFTDEEFDLFLSVSEDPIWVVEYRLAANIEGINEYSNVIAYDVVAQQFGGMPSPNGMEETFTWNLSENYPNPFNPITKIVFEIAKAEKVELKVYNVLGQVVSELVNEFKEPGRYSVDFNASQLSSGIYFYRIKAGDFVKTNRMLLLK